ncbi:hypothetical protein TTRE_0000100101 [Trichuris trichiura]|uniref:Uncharacterized protein n=1 Tax=Trichuris trichiura TaxID=36087 RepID=A0A077YYE0_TRITR|nr:hypothetical protein TTRE_0000100101 [Trichuris trichiura]
MEEGEIVDDDSDYFNLSDEIEERTNDAKQSGISLVQSAQIANECQDILWYDCMESFKKKQNYGDDGKCRQTDSLMVALKPTSLNNLQPEEREEYMIRYWMQRVSKTYGDLSEANAELQSEINSTNEQLPLSKSIAAQSIDEALDESVEKLFCTINKYWSNCSGDALEQQNETESKSNMMTKWITGSCDAPNQLKRENVYRIREVINFPYNASRKKVIGPNNMGNAQKPMLAKTETRPTPVKGSDCFLTSNTDCIEQASRQFQPIASNVGMNGKADLFHQMGRGGIVANSASPYNFNAPTKSPNMATINRPMASNNLYANWIPQNQWTAVPPRLPTLWNPVTTNQPSMNLRPMAQQANFCDVMQTAQRMVRCDAYYMWHNQWPAFPPGQIPQQRFLYPPPNYPPWHP